MATRSGDNRVSDEQMAEWEDHASVGINTSATTRALIAEVRALRAREGKLRGQRDYYWQKLLTVAQELRVAEAEREDHRRMWQAEMATVGELQDDVEHQRGMYEQEHDTVHELQQRINDALAIYGNAGSIDDWLAKMVAALTGKECTDHG